MARMTAGLVAGCTVLLMFGMHPGAPPVHAQENSSQQSTGGSIASPVASVDSAEKLREELEATRARLEALEKALDRLQPPGGSKDGAGAVSATPTVGDVVAQLRDEARNALARARRAREKADAQRGTVSSEALARALEGVVEAAEVLEKSVEAMDVDALEEQVRDSRDVASAQSTLAAIRKVAGRLQTRLQEESAALDAAEARVRQARRRSEAWPDVVGEQETDEGDRVALLSNSVVKAGDRVADFVVVGGNGTVAGEVGGDAVVIGGDLRLESTAHVHGDAVVIGGRIRVADGAVIDGQRVQMSSSAGLSHLIGSSEEEDRAGPEDEEDETSGWLASVRHALATYLVLVGLGLLSLTVAPTRIRNVAAVMEAKPRQSGVTGLMILIALLPATLLLVVTVVGILFVPFVYVLLGIASVAGLTALILVLARKLPYRRHGQTVAGGVLWGAALLAVATMIPYVRFWVGIAALSFALGAVVLSKLGREQPSDFPF